MKKNDMKLARRKSRVRYEIKMKSGGRPRLSVHRSEKHIYAQIIDDTKGITLASASSMEKGFAEKVPPLPVLLWSVNWLPNVL